MRTTPSVNSETREHQIDVTLEIYSWEDNFDYFRKVLYYTSVINVERHKNEPNCMYLYQNGKLVKILDDCKYLSEDRHGKFNLTASDIVVYILDNKCESVSYTANCKKYLFTTEIQSEKFGTINRKCSLYLDQDIVDSTSRKLDFARLNTKTHLEHLNIKKLFAHVISPEFPANR